MLTLNKQTLPLNPILSADQLQETLLHGEYTDSLDLDLGDTFEILDVSFKIDEMQIDKLYQYL